jgi:aryl-alcohol dehydrogenase-like predicted oxidoreductase
MNFPCNRLPDGTPISAFGLGCSAYWAKPSFDRNQAVALVHRAQALGINHFDTGPSYAGGDAERRLGHAIRSMDRSRLVVTSKVGTYSDAAGKQFRSFEPAQIRASVEQSLQRLQVAQLDILYLHGPGIGDLSVDVIDCLDGLKTQGLIRYSGVNSFDRDVLKTLVQIPIDVVMPQYNIYDVRCGQEIQSLKASGKTIIGGTALGQGVFDLRTLLPTNRKSLWYLLRKLKNDPLFPFTRWQARRRIDELGGDPLQAALAFLLKSPAVTSSVFGTTSITHLEQNAKAACAAAVA